MKVQLFVPCFIDQVYPQIAVATIKVLRKLGCDVVYNEAQTCCGQPAFNAGFQEDAKDVCRKFIKDFDGDGYVVGPSASCVGFVKNYYKDLFGPDDAQVQALSARAFELSEFIVDVLGKDDLGASLPVTATYHDSCAALREMHIKSAPRKLLSKVDGLVLKEMKDVETCCGFGGTFTVKFQGISSAMADQKSNNAIETGATHLISTDASCLMHIGGHAQKTNKQFTCMHIAEVLASGW